MENLNKFFARVLPIFPLYYLIVLGVVVLFRLQYPFHLDWIEGAHVDQVTRVLDGKQIYVAPSMEFIPFIYTPLYFWVSAVFSKIFGLGFFSLRLLSILCAMGSLILIHKLVVRESTSRLAGLMAAGLMAATYKISGSSLDLGRIDSLSLFLLLGGLSTLHIAKSQKMFWASAALFGLAFLTKQLAALPILGLSVYILLFKPKFILAWVLGLITTIGLVSLVMQISTNGWYGYYIFELPRMVTKYFITEWIIRFWTNDLWKFLSVPLLTAIAYLALGKKRIFFTFVFTSMLVGSFLIRSNDGGSPNALLPIYSIISILFGLAFAKWYQSKFQWIASTLVIAAFLGLTYGPLKQIPTKEDLLMGEKILSLMQEYPGEVYAPRYGYLPKLVGKKTNAHRSVLADLIRTDKPKGKKVLKEIKEAMVNQKFGFLLCQSDLFPETLSLGYKPKETIPIIKSKFWWPNHDPITLYLPLPVFDSSPYKQS